MKKQETQQERMKKFLSWIGEAQLGHQVWRGESWEDYAFRDGLHWQELDRQALLKKGINPLTINRIFPIINLVQGNYINNQKDIVAKGRTKKDSELSQTMSESIAFINDQNNGTFLQRLAFEDEIIAGFGCVEVGYNSDPRREKIMMRQNPWYSIWWDPFASPWMEKDTCRYAFKATWKDADDVKMIFPEKAQEIDEVVSDLQGYYLGGSNIIESQIWDEGTVIEDYKSFLTSSFWLQGDRRRVRPVELWYPKITPGTFAKMNDDTVYDLDDLYDPTDILDIIRNAREIIKVPVKKMWVATIFGDLELQNIPSPYAHDEYPFVPFVGYTDRYGFPYGIPRQIKEQNMEVDKRRSMALALLNSRRVIIEDKAARNEKEAQIEANRPDGWIVMRKNKMNAIKIEDMSKLAPAQIDLMNQSEREINEIAGSNTELQRNIPAQSGVALEQRKQVQATTTVSLFDNARISQKKLGERLIPLIQDDWTNEKVLRVTDRLTGSEKFSVINERVYDDSGNVIEIKNDITQGRYDIVISSKPMTDTMREKNMELLFAAINKADANAMPILLDLAFELSDLPDKDQLLERLRSVTGTAPLDTDLTKEERQQKLIEQEQVKKVKQEENDEIQKAGAIADLDAKRARTEKDKADAAAALMNARVQKEKLEQDGWIKGQEIAMKFLEGGDKGDTAGGSSIRKTS